MSLLPLIEYEDAGPEVRAVYDEIINTRGADSIHNFWKVLANHPETLAGVWGDVKRVMMKPGALNPLIKEMIYLAVSATNNCEYCIHSHTAGARARGMTDEMYAEVMAVTALANETNRLSNGFRVPVDDAFLGFPDREDPRDRRDRAARTG